MKANTMKSPSGEIVNIKNMSQFCVEMNLSNSAMNMVCSGKRNHHKGWRIFNA